MRRTADIDALEGVLCAAIGSRVPVCSLGRLGQDADAFAALDPAVVERPTLIGGGAPYAPTGPAPARPALDELLRRAAELDVPQVLVPQVRRSDDTSVLREAGFVPVAADPECVFRLAGDVDEALRTRVGADRLGELRRRHGEAAREVRWERFPLRELDGHAGARDAFVALHESAAPREGAASREGTTLYNADALDALARGPLAERTVMLVARRGDAVVQAGLLTRSHNGRGVYCLTLATHDAGPGAARDLREAALYEVYVDAQRSGLDWVHLGRGDAARMRGLGADLFVPVDHWLRAPGLTPPRADGGGEPALSAFAAPPVASVPVPGPARFRSQPRFDVVDLSSNTNPFLGTASHYPELDTAELARTYLSTVGRLPGHEGLGALSTDHVLFTSGAVDGALLLLAALASPGERVCVTSPTFPLYDHFARVLRLPVVDVPLRGEDVNELDVERILAAEPKVTILCDPNNPVGTRLDEARVHALVAGGQGLVVIDEAYVEFSEKPSYAGLVARHDNLIVLRTLSKAWGLASARCGVVLAQPGVVDALRRVQVPFGFTNASQRAVRDRLTDAPRVLYSVRRVRAEREWMAATLADHPAVERVFPSETNFLLVRLHKHERVLDRLQAAGILVADTGRVIPDTCRISIGDRRANNSLLAALTAAL
ncbi:aminotransferase class I/II-fold pyridoxal phosphate-dependent enzyme [Streptomyces sp. NRRL B-1347]|uniref:aminotransferase class I/II-fold pyridoxal phosphate-dependent enzyme n=1 Tax=Streptomyces sp. NRRL B-1347 TaxID=1476877 RepID=UPI0004C69618|nr:aminotransferase class I/II-fold pyridoxal phosphate-dependent enzyme [Streptomyces sp. NRRL B-1347]